MTRPTISTKKFFSVTVAIPAPPGHSWQLDPAASSDRVRLFREGPGLGQVGAVYAKGDWFVEVPGMIGYAANGSEPDLESGMRRMMAVAVAMGVL